MNKVRTRFAPSPTGYLHIGGIRTAIFAWLMARQSGGEFLLRIEDTDKKRQVEGSIEHIVQSLDWLGLDRDEEIRIQSDYKDLYVEYAKKLIAKGLAYADPTTSEELAKLREKAQNEKRAFHFRDHRPANPPEWREGLPLRLRIDATSSPAWTDLVRGEQKSSTENLDDFILLKADGFPTYNFAHIVDDHEMNITHVVRGEEFISSMPKFLMLYEALDFTPPKFAHLPSILSAEGNKKLSKRDGAPDLLRYRDDGFLPETVLNFLAKLGWNDGTEQEVYTRDELIEKFDITRVQKAGARYDEKQLLWLNGQHIRKLNPETFVEIIETKNLWPDSADRESEEYRAEVGKLLQDRIKTLNEVKSTDYFFADPKPSLELIGQHKQLSKLSNGELKSMLVAISSKLSKTDYRLESVQNALNELLDELGQKPVVLFSLLRISLTQAPYSPDLASTVALLGQETVERRINNQVELL